MTEVKLTSKGFQWFKSLHPWIFRDDISFARSAPENGDIVRVVSPVGSFLAYAFYSASSNIALRVISREDIPPDRNFFAGLIKRAVSERKGLTTEEDACRLVNAEGDLFPGLIVDYYAGHLVLQITIPGVERIKDIVVDILLEMFEPKSLTLRCDLATRSIENLPLYKEMAKGEEQREVVIVEGKIKYLADLWEGHKTAVYLDQRENRLKTACLSGERALDAFCYQGHFSLHLASLFREIISVDSSAPAIERLKGNLKLNGIENIKAVKENVFDYLSVLAKQGEKFDLVILDPPPFAKSKKDINSAKRGYRELNRKAISLLKEGGKLLTYSCSYNILPDDFLELLKRAAGDAGRNMKVVGRQFQARDHTVLLNAPETAYLKGFLLECY